MGDLDLTLVDFEMLDEGSYSALSDANARVRVRAVNTRDRTGEAYRFAPFAPFLLDDESGVGRGPQLCLRCEDLMGAVELDQGAEIGGSLYFSLAEGQHAAMLRYTAPLSRNRAEFSLD